MGSGKGQAKRVQAINAPSTLAETWTYNESIWKAYCKENDLVDDNLVEYYLGEKVSSSNINTSQAEFVLTEFLRDLLLSNSITDSDGFTATNTLNPYELKIKARSDNHSGPRSDYHYGLFYIPRKQTLKLSHALNVKFALTTGITMVRGSGTIEALGPNNPHKIIHTICNYKKW